MKKRLSVLLLLVVAAMAATAGKCLYYQPYEKYTGEDFFNGIDVPTNFGVGFVPDKQSGEQFAYYSSMFLEYRYYRSFGWFVIAGLDAHDHDYKNQQFPGINSYSNTHYNSASGTVFNMQLVVGGGYRIPILPLSWVA